MSLPDAASLETFSVAELREIVGVLVAEVGALQARVDAQQATIVALRAENQVLRDEVARLKGLPPRPPSRPSGMEQATQPGATGADEKRPKLPRGIKRDAQAITAERVLKVAVPAGSRFKGYEDIGVARPAAFGRGDPLSARALAAALWRDGAGSLAGGDRGRVRAGTAALRAGAACPGAGDDGAAHRLAERDRGGDLETPGGAPLDRAARGLRGRGPGGAAGRAGHRALDHGGPAQIACDFADTAARHARKDGFTTQIGDDRFTVFRTGTSKSREAFLSLLRAGHTDYVVNAAALDYMRGHSLSGQVVAQLDAHPAKRFADTSAWAAHLARLCINTLTVTPDPVQIATEGGAGQEGSVGEADGRPAEGRSGGPCATMGCCAKR